MKTKEELTALKDEVKALNAKLAELSEEELNEVIGGVDPYEHNVMLTEAAPVGAERYRFKLCVSCGEVLKCPESGHGTIECSHCKTINNY